MGNILVSLILLGILVSSIMYIYKAKKSGQKCIGCPHGSKTDNNESCTCDIDLDMD